MNVVSVIMLAFAVFGAIDRLIGNKIGVGKEFEKGILLLGQLVLSMMGMIILAPVLAQLLNPFFNFVYNTFKIEPSVLPAMIFANDMGGAILAKEIAQNSELGMFNGMIVASMMGATVSFTIPMALGCIKKEKHNDLMIGLLCGVITIPIGCFIGGLICKISVLSLLIDLLPLIIFSLITAIGLWLVPNICVKIFIGVGFILKLMIAFGFILGGIDLLLGIKVIEDTADVLYAAKICLSAAFVMSGAFPLLFIISKVLSKPLNAFGNYLKINNKSTLGFISTLANNVSTFEIMNGMDEKGTILNSAFAVSASFLLADHLAFTLAFEPSYLLSMIVAKIISGLAALILAIFVYKRVGAHIQRDVSKSSL